MGGLRPGPRPKDGTGLEGPKISPIGTKISPEGPKMAKIEGKNPGPKWDQFKDKKIGQYFKNKN